MGFLLDKDDPKIVKARYACKICGVMMVVQHDGEKYHVNYGMKRCKSLNDDHQAVPLIRRPRKWKFPTYEEEQSED